MKKFHKKVWLHLEKKNQEVAKKANKGRKRVKLEPVRERLNNNAYKIYLPLEYQVHNTFNVCDLSPFLTIDDDDPSNLRTNSFQEGENHAIPIPSRPFTRIQARDLQKMEGLFMKLEALGMVLIANKGYALRNEGVQTLLASQSQSTDRPRA
ncbi:hypothetical protein KY285_010792 [Solanum tuberosum]|nr:hypothetical protein KY289_011361 [Solanum tuberosum]KAH0735085.1 hypothetical protein KY285_010792 [Solanum tuberosum]